MMPPADCLNRKPPGVGIIGTINRDTIIFPDGSSREGWGGIYYNITTLSRLIGRQAEIYPVCNIGKDCYPALKTLLGRLPGVAPGGAREVPEKNNHCHLTYTDCENKNEILSGGVKPLRFDEVKDLLSCRIILVNFISGRDIYLRSLEKFRRLFAGKLYVDVHSYTLGKRSNGSRYLRRPRGWPRIIDMADYIQLNSSELKVLLGKKSLSPAKHRLTDLTGDLLDDLRRKRIATQNKVLIITDGAAGCFLSYEENNKRLQQHIAPDEVVLSGDATGCGDCFSAGFVAGLVCGRTPADSARLGNEAATYRLKYGPEC
jgi:hypothetical protein